MKVFRYWAAADQDARDKSGRALHLRRWGGSNESATHARALAVDRVRELAERVKTRSVSKYHIDSYAYCDRDIPEEFIKETAGGHAVTRNRYGGLILNSERALFVDIDVLPPPSWLMRLFGRSSKTADDYLTVLQAWLVQHPEAGVRVYRTAAGMRYLFTHAPIALNEAAVQWLKELGADPLYTTLCQKQKCYRARLTPKPWRLGIPNPPNHFPRETGDAQQRFRRWLETYENKSTAFAACRFLSAYGQSRIHPELSEVVALHDDMTRAMETESVLA